MTIYFNGRADGLGNRIEQLINLELLCIKNQVKCEYYWENKYKNRIYSHELIQCKNIIIQHNKKYACPTKVYFMNETATHEEMIEAAANVKILIDTQLPAKEYISVHIRSTDKLNNRGKDEFDRATFNTFFNKTINILNGLEAYDNLLYIASDDMMLRDYMISKLNKKLKVIEIDSNYLPELMDYYMLMNSKEIYMLPKFSSYAACASLMGDNILHSYFDENETSLHRYKCKINRLVD